VGRAGGSDDSAREEFESFVSARGPSLLRTAFLLTGDRGKAEDLVQTALGQTWPKWGSIQAQPREAYVRKVLVNTYIAWWLRRWNAEDPTERLPERPVSDGDAAMRLVLRHRNAIQTMPLRHWCASSPSGGGETQLS
jgi:DNA-directed RNA polymerase specialized sigma24 family protein